MGYPVVTITLNFEHSSLMLRQQHFLIDYSKQPDPKYPSRFK